MNLKYGAASPDNGFFTGRLDLGCCTGLRKSVNSPFSTYPKRSAYSRNSDKPRYSHGSRRRSPNWDNSVCAIFERAEDPLKIYDDT